MANDPSPHQPPSGPPSPEDGPRVPPAPPAGPAPTADPEPPQPAGPAQPPEPPASRSAPLQAALTRAVSTPPRWRSHLRTAGFRGVFPVLAALTVVMVLSLVGIAAPWDGGPTPARGIGATEDGLGSVNPSPSPADPRDPTGRSLPGAAAPDEPAEPGPDPACDPPLSVVVSPDLAGVVAKLAGSLTRGACPQVAVTAQEPPETLGVLSEGDAPDVWIPASTLWLQRAITGAGEQFPTSGTSIARTPIVVAVPKPVHKRLDGLPVWMLVYNEVTGEDGQIAQASMPDYRTTIGALAQISLQEALLANAEGAQDRAFLMLINFRSQLATTNADSEKLLRGLETASAAQASQIGAFPATEQQLIAYHQRDPAMPVVPMGTYDANIHADYPMAVNEQLDDRLAGVAADLRAQLRSPAATEKLAAAGFRPPMDRSPGVPAEASGFPDGYPDPFPSNYPDPVSLPSRTRWQEMIDGWTWEG